MAALLIALLAIAPTANALSAKTPVDVYALRNQVLKSQVVLDKIAKTCKAHTKVPQCETRAGDALFCQLLERNNPDLAAEHCAAKEMTHDLEMNFNKIAPFGKEDTAKELQDHAAKTQ